MGQRLVIEYETAQLVDREALITAEMRLLPPFGSSSTRSTPYTIKTSLGNLEAKAKLIEALRELRDSKELLSDRQIIQQLRNVSNYAREFALINEAADSYGPRRETSRPILIAPPFESLDGDLERVVARYLSSRDQNGTYQECVCHINLKQNTVWAQFKEAYRRPNLKEIEVIGVSKPLPTNVSEARAMQIAWRNLTGIADQTMNTFQRYGAHCAMSELKSSLPHGRPPDQKSMPEAIDERLRRGIIRDFAHDTVVTLSSGNKAVLEVGDEVAALSISASDQEDCSTCCYVFDSKTNDYLRQNWEAHLDKIRSLMQKLGDSSRMSHDITLDQLSQHASPVFDRRCSISHIVGDRVAQSLAELDEAGCLKAWLPNTAYDSGRYDLLLGRERVDLTLAHFPGAQENLGAFSSVRIFVGAAGNIDVHLDNQLGKQLRVLLSEQAVTKWGGVGKVINSLAFALSTRDIGQAHSKVQQLLEKMASPDSKSSGQLNTELARRTFATALEIVNTAHSKSNCYGNHTAELIEQSRAVAAVHFVSAFYAIEFEVEDESIRTVALRGEPYISPQDKKVRCFPTVRFSVPSAAVPLLMKALPEIFADYYDFSGPRGYFSREASGLERTKIFQFLTTHGQRISGDQSSAEQ
jgi:hypothetical protein